MSELKNIQDLMQIMQRMDDGGCDLKLAGKALAWAQDRIQSLESLVEGCSSRNASDVDRIAALEAPYKLVDTPPSEPGWYLIRSKSNQLITRFAEVYWWNESTLGFSYIVGEPCFMFESYKWGSAPLPIPESDDE